MESARVILTERGKKDNSNWFTQKLKLIPYVTKKVPSYIWRQLWMKLYLPTKVVIILCVSRFLLNFLVCWCPS